MQDIFVIAMGYPPDSNLHCLFDDIRRNNLTDIRRMDIPVSHGICPVNVLRVHLFPYIIRDAFKENPFGIK